MGGFPPGVGERDQRRTLSTSRTIGFAPGVGERVVHPPGVVSPGGW